MKSMVIARSRKLFAYLLFIHSVMLVVLLSLFEGSWWSLLVTLIMVISFIYYAQQYQWLKAKKSVISIDYHADNQWSLHYLDGSKKMKLTLTRSFVTPHLVILYFNHGYFWQHDVITIIDDAVDEKRFRQLRVYLRSPKTFQQ